MKGPGNWTIDTVSDLLRAMRAELNISVSFYEDIKPSDTITILPGKRESSIKAQPDNDNGIHNDTKTYFGPLKSVGKA